MSAIPDTSTAGPDIPIILDRGVITMLVKGLLSILHPAYFRGPLSGEAKTKVPVQTNTYAFVLERLGLPNHRTAFAVVQTVSDIMERTPAGSPFAESQDMTAGEWNRALQAWKQAVIDGIVDRYMGHTTEDYPEGLAPLDMPHWWQKKHLDPKTCLPHTDINEAIATVVYG
jgi:hypothetical protein